MIDKIKQLITASLESKKQLLSDEILLKKISSVADEIVKAFTNGGKVLLCGNGGSAADAQHIAAEMSGRFYFDRDPLDAEALHVNTSYLTAVANDYSYDEVYSRAVKAKGKPGDLLIGISTSGNSRNVIRACEQARVQKMVTIAMTGSAGGKLKTICDYLINVPSGDTPRIQEMHILIGHIICQLAEEKLFPAH